MLCEVCQTDKDLLTCGFDGQAMLYFCPEDMIPHLENAHPNNAAAQEMAQQIRTRLKKPETGLRKLSKLTGYQALVYIGLTEVIEPEYSDAEALALIEKHSKMIAERERRRFEPYAVARAIQEAETKSNATFGPFGNAIANALAAFVRDYVNEGCHHSCTRETCSYRGKERMVRAEELLALVKSQSENEVGAPP